MTDARSPHTFHIPVMGTGFVIDAPLRIAQYGISSVISLVDDVLIEQMRAFHCQQEGEPYEVIPGRDEDARAHRITAYLDLVDRLVARQVERLQASPFEPGSPITRYFAMLPDSPLSRAYQEMLATTDPGDRIRRQDQLRPLAVPGGIDVNIMAKVDRRSQRDGQEVPGEFSDALAALRGFARSTLESSLVLSAGFNPALYGYAAEFPDFFPDEKGHLKKRIILKVSDYHSAVVQGKYLARRGLWVSEFRIESGLNCGGHAFPTKGLLLGPILDEFQRNKSELLEMLRNNYKKALAVRGRSAGPLSIRVTVQGGIGTADEDRLLREHYHADGTGWGTPFLLVPEVANVDDEQLRKLCEATKDDVYLSDSSPFGMPFWTLRSSASEETRRRRIAEGRPGSPCSKGYVKLFNVEFSTYPICTASREYQKAKLEELSHLDVTEELRAALREGVLAKACICHDLAGGATLKNGIDPDAVPAVCCGPNIVNFSKVATLEEMVGHIYGTCSLLNDEDRPHMLLRELGLYLEYLTRELAKHRLGLSAAMADYFRGFLENLREGIEHYRRLAGQIVDGDRERFVAELDGLARAADDLQPAIEVIAGTVAAG